MKIDKYEIAYIILMACIFGVIIWLGTWEQPQQAAQVWTVTVKWVPDSVVDKQQDKLVQSPIVN